MNYIPRKRRLGLVPSVTIFILLLTSTLPFVWILMTSLKSPADIVAWPPKFIFTPTFQNYLSILGRGTGRFAYQFRTFPFVKLLYNTMVVTAASVGGAITASALSAYALSRLRPRGTTAINFIILGTRMVPPIALVVPLFMLYNVVGWHDTLLGLILPFTALNIPMTTWMLEGFFQDLPKNLEDAALIDGCGVMGAFVRVILPLAAPGLVATAIFAFILSWNELTLPLALTMFEAPTLPVLASQVRTDEGILYGQLGAVAVLMNIPIVLFAGFGQRYLVSGLTGGSIKG